jgi:hypothetical protein
MYIFTNNLYAKLSIITPHANSNPRSIPLLYRSLLLRRAPICHRSTFAYFDAFQFRSLRRSGGIFTISEQKEDDLIHNWRRYTLHRDSIISGQVVGEVRSKLGLPRTFEYPDKFHKLFGFTILLMT